MNYKHGFIVSLVLIIIAILVVGGGTYIFTQTKPADPSATANPTLPKATSTAQTSDWKTYKNTLYGLEFKYPSGWYIWDGEDHKSDVGIYIYEHRTGPDLPGVTRMMIIGRGENETTDVKTYAEKNTLGINSPVATETDSGLLKKEEGYITVAQTQSYRVYIKSINREGAPECSGPSCDKYKNIERLVVTTYIPHKTAIYSAIAQMAGDTEDGKKKISSEEEANYLSLYNQILSTLKFNP